ncbi:hypothetical protein PsW64_03833 [Pseudovibrio sp. W64]|uniref:hypothetical protein n=1 Tax=Pseudovibrio sp. W64 TaxID=1735583 RepID=UPI0007AEB92F|nr:hypothetical protein [Pseudovibrio sp. W64]KZK78194.1 hypothetical protein PsW64_03833 [Pseudovibrio sp. W64]
MPTYKLSIPTPILMLTRTITSSHELSQKNLDLIKGALEFNEAAPDIYDSYQFGHNSATGHRNFYLSGVHPFEFYRIIRVFDFSEIGMQDYRDLKGDLSAADDGEISF